MTYYFLILALIALLIIIIGLFNLLYLYIFHRESFEKWMKNMFPELIKADYSSGILVLTYSNETTKRFTKLDTKFYELPMMNLCDNYKQEELDKIDKYIHQWNGEYPTAHLKSKK